MKTIAIIPARSGSKGVINKNIRKLGNKTLIEYAVDVALSSGIDDVYISTDSAEYEKIAIDKGAKSIGLRSKDLSGDNTKIVDVVIDLLDKLKLQKQEFNYVLLLQPTSPQRNKDEINQILQLIKNNQADAIVSLSKLEEPHPYKLKVINQGKVIPFINSSDSEVSRQNHPAVYRLTGAYYLIKKDILYKERTFLPVNTIPFITPNVVNIDTEDDLIYANYLYEKDLL